ncbi:hypothetical protein [Bacillus thuringiensis]|nr:hypothetical protein [Bacillus thuringiensis]
MGIGKVVLWVFFWYLGLMDINGDKKISYDMELKWGIGVNVEVVELDFF